MSAMLTELADATSVAALDQFYMVLAGGLPGDERRVKAPAIVARGLQQPAAGAGAGANLQVKAQNAGSGNTAGGNVTLEPGLRAGAGADGRVVVLQPGGTPGTHQGDLRHDGSHFRMESQTGRIYLYAGGADRLYVDPTGYVYFLGSQIGSVIGLAFDKSLSLDDVNQYSWRAGVQWAGVIDTGISRVAAGQVRVTNGGSGNGMLVIGEVTEPANPAADRAVVFARDVAGKTQLAVRFASGASVQLAIEP